MTFGTHPVLHSHPEIEISFKFIPKILMSKECIHFFWATLYLGRLSDVARIEDRIFMKFICDNLPLGFYRALWSLKLQLRIM